MPRTLPENMWKKILNKKARGAFLFTKNKNFYPQEKNAVYAITAATNLEAAQLTVFLGELHRALWELQPKTRYFLEKGHYFLVTDHVTSTPHDIHSDPQLCEGIGQQHVFSWLLGGGGVNIAKVITTPGGRVVYQRAECQSVLDLNSSEAALWIFFMTPPVRLLVYGEQFKQEVYAGVLRVLLFPRAGIKLLAEQHIENKAVRADCFLKFTKRLDLLAAVAFKSGYFLEYLASEQAKQEMHTYAQVLQKFKIKAPFWQESLQAHIQGQFEKYHQQGLAYLVAQKALYQAEFQRAFTLPKEVDTDRALVLKTIQEQFDAMDGAQQCQVFNPLVFYLYQIQAPLVAQECAKRLFKALPTVFLKIGFIKPAPNPLSFLNNIENIWLLHWFSQHQSIYMVDFPTPIDRARGIPENPLCIAVKLGDGKAVQAALSKKINVLRPDRLGRTAIFYAHNVNICNSLIVAGADLHYKDCQRKRPLDGFVEMTQELREYLMGQQLVLVTPFPVVAETLVALTALACIRNTKKLFEQRKQALNLRPFIHVCDTEAFVKKVLNKVCSRTNYTEEEQQKKTSMHLVHKVRKHDSTFKASGVEKYLNWYYRKEALSFELLQVEVFTQELLRALSDIQPKTRYLNKDNKWYVLSKEVKRHAMFYNARASLKARLLKGEVTGLGRVLVFMLLVNQEDLHLNNILFNADGVVIGIDGEKCFEDARGTAINPITAADLLRLPLIKDYKPDNWLDLVVYQGKYDSVEIATYELQQLPAFKKEIYEGIVRGLLLPMEAVFVLANTWLVAPGLHQLLLQEMAKRQKNLQEAAFENGYFIEYLLSSQCLKDAKRYAYELAQYKIKGKIALWTDTFEQFYWQDFEKLQNMARERQAKITNGYNDALKATLGLDLERAERPEVMQQALKVFYTLDLTTRYKVLNPLILYFYKHGFKGIDTKTMVMKILQVKALPYSLWRSLQKAPTAFAFLDILEREIVDRFCAQQPGFPICIHSPINRSGIHIRPPVILAIGNNDLKGLKACLAAGWDANCQHLGTPAIFCAVALKNSRMIDALIAAGADLKVTCKGKKPLEDLGLIDSKILDYLMGKQLVQNFKLGKKLGVVAVDLLNWAKARNQKKLAEQHAVGAARPRLVFSGAGASTSSISSVEQKKQNIEQEKQHATYRS